MSRTILAVRHGKPEGSTNPTDSHGPHLAIEAIEAAKRMRLDNPRFSKGIGVMAVTDTWRSKETATLLGASSLITSSALNELTPSLSIEELRAMAAAGEAPREFIDAGLQALTTAPTETDYWVIHGWKGMGILAAVVEVGGTHNATSLLIPNLATVEFTY
jgi:broad specificity phosphatase PhoE